MALPRCEQCGNTVISIIDCPHCVASPRRQFGRGRQALAVGALMASAFLSSACYGTPAGLIQEFDHGAHADTMADVHRADAVLDALGADADTVQVEVTPDTTEDFETTEAGAETDSAPE